jgi:pimeloyl-ACP methyl ester carboxylesterase
MVITDAAAGHPAVRHLIYVSSMLPDVGESQADITGPAPAPWVLPHSDGTVELAGADLRELFLQDCDQPAVDGAMTRTARQSAMAFAEPARAAAWHDTPSTYVVCTLDQATPADRQRMFAERATEVTEIAAGHHPFLSRPDELGRLIAKAVERP